jgi:peptidoglycan/xylan/chitin deacetylase (PgdA/CDA1 family)
MRGKLWRVKKHITKFIPGKCILFEGDVNSNQIALTFDDGPNSDYTERFLQVLRHYKIKANFFVLGENLEKYPDIAKEIVKERHLLGNHTYSHRNSYEISIRRLSEELSRTKELIKKISGRDFNYFRPTYGRFSLVTLGYCMSKRLTTVLWSLDSRDFERKGVKHILDNVISDGIRGGDIVLFHDNNEFTLEALPEVIEHLQRKGFEFVTVEEMLK